MTTSQQTRLAQSAERYKAAREKLHSDIRDAHAAGISLRRIAAEVNMSHEQVRRLISRDQSSGS